jgi:hypothetical protein
LAAVLYRSANQVYFKEEWIPFILFYNSGIIPVEVMITCFLRGKAVSGKSCFADLAGAREKCQFSRVHFVVENVLINQPFHLANLQYYVK